jgi:hypothetical protein
MMSARIRLVTDALSVVFSGVAGEGGKRVSGDGARPRAGRASRNIREYFDKQINFRKSVDLPFRPVAP